MATQYVTCPNCHSQNTSGGSRCLNCGSTLPMVHAPMQPTPGYYVDNKPPGSDKKILAGILGIVLGGLGIQKFVLGYNTEGIIMLVVYIVGLIFLCGIPSLVIAIIGIVEGIMYLTKSDEEFVQTYIINKKPWF